MRAAIIALASLCIGAQAEAGAWPREKGSTFLSFSHAASTGTTTLLTPEFQINNYTSVFAEYGLTEKLTIGLNAGFGGDDDYSVQAGYVFARHPVWSDDSGHRVAAEIGFGLVEDEPDGRQNRVIPGLSWGYGFESRWGGGWAGIEASADYRIQSGETAWKGDVTLGLKPTENWMLILQVQNGLYPDAEPLMRLAPSVVRKLGGRAHLQFGAFAGLVGDDSIGAKTAIWFSF
jgi:hypothetical protein